MASASGEPLITSRTRTITVYELEIRLPATAQEIHLQGQRLWRYANDVTTATMATVKAATVHEGRAGWITLRVEVDQ